MRDFGALLVIAVGYVVALTYLGQLRLDNFYTSNWDLGINQQILWTGAHGRLLYETGDMEFAPIHTFLQVHDAYIALLIAPLYAAAPAPATLFAIQASAFAASSIPLYLIARRAIESRMLIIAVIVLYLTSFAVLSGLLYDFHWEAFIPVEFLGFFYLMETRRYAWSLVPIAFGVLTLEVFPFLVASVAILLLYEALTRAGFHWRSFVSDRDTRVGLVLILGMGGVVLLGSLMVKILSYFLGPYPVGGGILSAAPSGATWSTLPVSAVYWLLLLAAFAFVPLLTPKYLILTIPWFVDSVFLYSPYSTYSYGFQWALIAASTLVVALVYGLGQLERQVLDRPMGWVLLGVMFASGATALLTGIVDSPAMLSENGRSAFLVVLAVPALVVVALGLYMNMRQRRPTRVRSEAKPPSRWRPARTTTPIIGGLLITFVAFNLVMSPLNPSNAGTALGPGYQVRYSPNPMAGEMGWMADMIPANSVVLASDNLFPWVANNPNAWAVPWYPVTSGDPPLFPFSASHLPRYVLIDQSQAYFLPSSILSALWNTSIYGLVAYVVFQPYPGSVYLFDLGYQGVPLMHSIGEVPSDQFFTASNLSIGPVGEVAPDSSSRFGSVVESLPPCHCSSSGPIIPPPTTLCIWYGPYQTFLPGNYTLAVSLSGGLYPGENESHPVLLLDSGSLAAPGQSFYYHEIYASEISATGWTTILLNFTLDHPFPLVEFSGYQFYYEGGPDGHVTLNYIELIPN